MIFTSEYKEKCKYTGIALPEGHYKRAANKARLLAKIQNVLPTGVFQQFLNTDVSLELPKTKRKHLMKWKKEYWKIA